MKQKIISLRVILMATLALSVLDASKLQGQTDNEPSVRHAVLYEGVDGVRQAIAAGADINEPDENGYTPLIWACSYSGREEYRESAKLLIEKGADVTIRANDGNTALIEAAGHSREVFDLLLAKGASPEERKDDGTGCFYQCMTGILFYGLPNLDLAELLVSKGADVNEAPSSGDLQGYTALLFASRDNNVEVVNFLLDNGADPNLANARGETPLALAEKAGNTEVVALLKARGAK